MKLGVYLRQLKKSLKGADSPDFCDLEAPKPKENGKEKSL